MCKPRRTNKINPMQSMRFPQKKETQKKVEPVKRLPLLHTLRVMLAGHSYIMLRVPRMN